MNKHAFLSIITVVLLGFSLVNHASGQEAAKEETGKTSAKEVQQKLNEAAEAIKNYSADKRDEAANKTKVALDALDNRIVALERELDKNWDKMNQAAREQSRKTLKALHEQRVKVAEWYGGFKNSSESAWEEMKKGFSEAYKALQQAWLEAEHEYEKEERRSR